MSVDSSAIFPWAIMRVVLPVGGATAAGGEAVGGACICMCVGGCVCVKYPSCAEMETLYCSLVAKCCETNQMAQ